MNFNFKKGWNRFAIFGLLLTALSLSAFNSLEPPVDDACTCGTPTNIVKTGYTISSVSFSWDAVSGATGYEVWYFRVNDSYTSSHSTVTSTSVGYTGLTAGRYIFYIATVCGEEKSEIIVLEDILIG